MNIAIVLVHNKGDKANSQQIETLKPLITKITDTHNEFDDKGNIIGTSETYHYELIGLSIPHEAKFYQIVPFGVDPPANFDDIDSHNVLYRNGDEDKTGDHPRFFNWGLKRGTDYGADIVIQITDPTSFDPKTISTKLTTLEDKTNNTELIADPEGRYGTLKLLTDIGQLDESKSVAVALTDKLAEVTALPVSEVLLG